MSIKTMDRERGVHGISAHRLPNDQVAPGLSPGGVRGRSEIPAGVLIKVFQTDLHPTSAFRHARAADVPPDRPPRPGRFPGRLERSAGSAGTQKAAPLL